MCVPLCGLLLWDVCRLDTLTVNHPALQRCSWTDVSLRPLTTQQLTDLALSTLADLSATNWTHVFCETTKAVCHSKAIVWENLLRSMHISLSWEGVEQWGYLLGYTDAIKHSAQIVGNCFHSVAINQESKQVEMSSRKQISIHRTWWKWNPVNKDHLQKRRNWTRYWQRIVGLNWWLNVWKTLILSGDFRFSAENECPFSFRFRP